MVRRPGTPTTINYEILTYPKNMPLLLFPFCLLSSAVTVFFFFFFSFSFSFCSLGISSACALPNKQNDLGVKRRLKSAWASSQSNQSLRCPHEDEEILGPQLSIERTAKILIRLRGSAGWSESSLGAHHFVGFVMLWLSLHICWIYSPFSMLVHTTVPVP